MSLWNLMRATLWCCGRAICVALSLSLAACSGGGSREVSASPSEARGPLVDDNVCGVVSTQALEEHLGLKVNSYVYSSSLNVRASESGGGPTPDGDLYTCYVDAYGGLYSFMEAKYSMAPEVRVLGGERVSYDFDEISMVFPESAVPVDYEGLEGEGWLWMFDTSAYLAWRYSDGHILTVQLTMPRSPTDDQVEGLRAVMEQAVPKVPAIAAAHVSPVKVPAPTPTPTSTS